MSIESVMLSSHLILCHPLLLLPTIPPSIRVFSNESTLRMRWPGANIYSSSRPRLEWEAGRSEGVGCAGRSIPGRGVSPGAPRRGAPGCRGLRPLLVSCPSFLPPAVAPVSALSQVTKSVFYKWGPPSPLEEAAKKGDGGLADGKETLTATCL